MIPVMLESATRREQHSSSLVQQDWGQDWDDSVFYTSPQQIDENEGAQTELMLFCTDLSIFEASWSVSRKTRQECDGDSGGRL